MRVDQARVAVSLVARQYVTREITRRQAGNHVCDFGMLIDPPEPRRFEACFVERLEYFGGKKALRRWSRK
jgi:hypothetical protein